MTAPEPRQPRPRVLAVSSWVGVGHVGLSAAAPVLERIGGELLALPTITLSNHAGWPAVAGRRTDPDDLRAMLDAVEANGWLRRIDAVLTGYMPSAAHAAVAREAIDRARALDPKTRIVVDPVLGDDPKGLYVAEDAAEAQRDLLLPAADILTPNRFELAWLTRSACETLLDARASAERLLAATRPNARLVLTSPPFDAPDRTGALEVAPDGARLYATPKSQGVPNGVGDALAALLAAGRPTDAALGALFAIIQASLGRDHLALTNPNLSWPDAPPIAYAPL